MTAKPIPDPIFTLTTGPVDAYPAVLRGLSRPVLYDYDPAFLAFYEAVNDKVQRAFRSSTPPVILQGEPVLALEAAAESLIAKGDVVLNLVSGVYGKGFGPWAGRHAGEVIELAVPYNEVLDPDAVAEALAQTTGYRRRGALPPRHAVRAPSTPRKRSARSCARGRAADRRRGLLLRRHGRVARGSARRHLRDRPEQVPGLSARTVASPCQRGGVAEDGGKPRRAARFGALHRRLARAHEATQPFPFTPSVSEINALDAALDLYLAEGDAAVWARHAQTAAACRAGIQAAGLSLWPAREEIASPTCTAVRLPEGVDEAKLRATIRDRYGVVVSSGRGQTLGKLIRIGHMGPTARPIYSLIAVAAVAGGLQALGVKGLDIGAGVSAAMRTIDSGAS